MKRHSSFVPLSREHHDGLSLAARLQQGTSASLTMWSHNIHWQAEYVVKFFDEHLAKHFRVEEEVLFHVTKPFLKEHRALVQHLLDEHRRMEEYGEFFRHPNNRTLGDTLKEFGKLLEGHIRAEERELFPLCEELIPADVLAEIGRKIRQFPIEGR